MGVTLTLIIPKTLSAREESGKSDILFTTLFTPNNESENWIVRLNAFLSVVSPESTHLLLILFKVILKTESVLSGIYVFSIYFICS